jgi:hypothetical protein
MHNNITTLALALNQCENCEEWGIQSLQTDAYGNQDVCEPCFDQSVEDSQEWESFCHDHRRGGWTTG